MTCMLETCDKPAFTSGARKGRRYCNMHYKRWRRHGSPYKYTKGNRFGTVELDERDRRDTLLDDPDFWDKVDAARLERYAKG